MIISTKNSFLLFFLFSTFSNINQVNRYNGVQKFLNGFFFQKKRKNCINKFLLILYKM